MDLELCVASGIGRYHRQRGSVVLSKLTPVFEQSRLSGMPHFAPTDRSPGGRMS